MGKMWFDTFDKALEFVEQEKKHGHWPGIHETKTGKFWVHSDITEDADEPQK